MEWPGWYCLGVLVVGVLVMARDIMGPDFAMLGMLVAIMLPGDRIISVDDALAGFSNEGLLTVAVLFVMAAGISETGALDYAFTQVLGTPSTTSAALVRMVIPVAVISAWLNNTPVVLILIPIITTWSRKAGLAPGHLFMPLSFASIIGGTITLIGTSTNLVVAGMQKDAFPDDPPLGMFDVSPYGVPVALAGIMYMVIFAPRLLPGKAKKVVTGAESMEDAFLVGLQVRAGSPAIGRTVIEAGLRGLDGLYLTSVKRLSSIVHAVSPDFIILQGDVLFFAGELAKVNGIAQRFRLRAVTDAFEEDLPAIMGCPEHHSVQVAMAVETGVRQPDEECSSDGLLRSPPYVPADESLRRVSVLPPTRLMQARVRKDAPDLINVSVRDANFRTKFDAAIVSIRREGSRLNSKLGDVVLQAGDELLFDCSNDFDGKSSAARSNLVDVGAVPLESGTEFMFAFEIPGKGGRRTTGDSDPTLPESRSAAKLFDIGRSSVAGKSIEAAGLRGLPDAFLVAIERGTTTLHAVPPTEVLQAGDVLWFAGGAEGVISLRKIPGLAEVDDQVSKLRAGVLDRRLVQVVLARTCDMLGKHVFETRFRSRFDAAIIAIHREGHRLRQSIGDVVLSAGDVLLLDTGSQFLRDHRSDRNFALIAEVADSQPPRFDRVLLALVCAVTAIAVAVVGITDLFSSAAAASGIMLLAGCLSGSAARRSVKWDVIVTIAAAFGLSNALEKTGAAEVIAETLVAVGKAAGGGMAIQVALYLTTVLLSNVVANNAAAALMYPIAINVAKTEGLDKTRMAVLLMLAASASFAVPFGYQTNLLVYGAGGYQFKDFLRFGGPIQVVVGVVGVGSILLYEYVYLIWAVMLAATVAVCSGPAIVNVIKRLLRPGRRHRMSSSPPPRASGNFPMGNDV